MVNDVEWTGHLGQPSNVICILYNSKQNNKYKNKTLYI